MLLNFHISAYARCLAGKVCSLVWSTSATSLCEDKLGARDKIFNTKVACHANIPPMPAPVHQLDVETSHGSGVLCAEKHGCKAFNLLPRDISQRP